MRSTTPQKTRLRDSGACSAARGMIRCCTSLHLATLDPAMLRVAELSGTDVEGNSLSRCRMRSATRLLPSARKVISSARIERLGV
jgi:hypothetical protein